MTSFMQIIMLQEYLREDYILNHIACYSDDYRDIFKEMI